MTIRTIGELREFIKEMSDDTPIICYKSDMETSGYRKGAYINKSNYIEKTKEGYDSFDRIDYTYKVFVEDKENGIEAVSIG